MTRDLDTLLRDADPLRDRPADDTALLEVLRERVDRERAGVVRTSRPSPWRRRVALVAAAAAGLTAVPVVISAVIDEDADRPVLTAAVADDGSIVCGESYSAAIEPGNASVRLLPDELPAGWSYTRIFAREESTTGTCVPPSLTALRQDAEGRVTGRISVTGPVDALLDPERLASRSVPDTVFGHAARRVDLQPHDVAFHHWVWADEQNRKWSVEASGMPLEEARQTLSAVSITGSDLAWNQSAAPGWTLVHLREGAPYGITGELAWHVELTDGSGPRFVEVGVSDNSEVPLLAGTGIGEQVTTVGGLPAVLGQIRRGEVPAGTETDVPPGTGTRPVLVEVSPGTVAWSWATEEDLPKVAEMLASLRQVGPTDPRLAKYGTE